MADVAGDAAVGAAQPANVLPGAMVAKKHTGVFSKLRGRYSAAGLATSEASSESMELGLEKSQKSGKQEKVKSELEQMEPLSYWQLYS